MSRRQLTLALVAVASLVVSACSSSPTAPQVKAPTAANADSLQLTPLASGWTGSNG